MKMLFGGVLLCATETPFIYLAVRTKGVVAPLIASAVMIFINIFIKFKDSGILSLVGVLLSCKWTIIRAELSERNFNVHHSGYFLAGNCGKFAQL